MLNQTNLTISSTKTQKSKFLSGLFDTNDRFSLNNDNAQIRLNRIRKLFPEFYDNYDYDSIQSNNRTQVSQALQILGLSSSDYDTGLIFDNGSSLLSDYSAENDTISNSQLINQLSTPLIYILFMLLLYSSIILVVFMSAVYTHRKRVGYNYDDSFDEFINQECDSSCEMNESNQYEFENSVYLETEKECSNYKGRIYNKELNEINKSTQKNKNSSKCYEDVEFSENDDENSEVDFVENEVLNDLSKEENVYKHSKSKKINDFSYMRMDQCENSDEISKNASYKMIKDKEIQSGSLEKMKPISSYIKYFLNINGVSSNSTGSNKIKKIDLNKYRNMDRRRRDDENKKIENKYSLSSIATINENQIMLDDFELNKHKNLILNNNNKNLNMRLQLLDTSLLK